ncbi:MAG: CoA transferase [Pseudomonadota bacterium]
MSDLFKDLKVVDAASFLAGPCAATILSDYGADVVKVEPLTGDRHRSIAAGHPADWSWQLTGRNKRSLAMDITTPQGYATLMRMLEQADVFLVNFSAANLTKYGLTWDELKARNPRLIFAQITAYGLQGPDAERRAFDITGFFCRSGIVDFAHDKGGMPSPPAGGVGDHTTAMTLFGGIMMALYKRDRTGEGSMVTTSLAATGTWANGLNLQATMAGVDGPRRRDAEGWSNPISNIYETRDNRFIMLGVQNAKRDWPTLARALKHPEWLEGEITRDIKVVFKNRFAVKEIVASAFKEMDAAEISARLDECGIVHALVAQTTEVIDDEQLIANGVIVPSDSGIEGVERTFATPFNLSDETQVRPQRAPEVGENSRSILDEFGFSGAEVDDLLNAGVIKQAD